MKSWNPPTRNTEKIQFEKVRAEIDRKFDLCHDTLTACFYAKQPFVWNGKDYGILTKEKFDKLHGLIFHLREFEFHTKNVELGLDKTDPKYHPDRYRYAKDAEGNLIEDSFDRLHNSIEALKVEGLELEIN